MSNEELLRDRYKVIAPYPHSPYKVGDLVEISSNGTSFHCTTTKGYDSFREDIVDSENYFSISQIENYQHLFKRLKWGEDRDEKDMPEYLRNIKDGDIVRVKKHFTNNFGIVNNCFIIFNPKDEFYSEVYREYEPSTKEEYEQQLKNKAK